MANLMAADLGFRRGNGDSGGDWRREASILLARRKRTARCTFSARRRDWGRHGMAALGVELRLLGGFS
jgi:hypothetical protein